jgi:hypothetical protein
LCHSLVILVYVSAIPQKTFESLNRDGWFESGLSHRLCRGEKCRCSALISSRLSAIGAASLQFVLEKIRKLRRSDINSMSLLTELVQNRAAQATKISLRQSWCCEL